MSNAIKYYVNRDNGVVVAKLDNLRLENSNMCSSFFDMYNLWSFDKFTNKVNDYINSFPDAYVGIARCYPGDVFDEDRGKELARARLLIKVNNTKAKIAHYVIKQLDEVKDTILKVENHHLNRATIMENKVSNILGRIEG